MSGIYSNNKWTEPSEYLNLKKSGFVSELQIERKQKISTIRTTSKHIASSMLLDNPDEKPRMSFRDIGKLSDLHQDNQDKFKLNSNRSMLFHKQLIQTQDNSSSNDFNDNLLRVKMEEISFKLKTKTGAFLKQLGTSQNELNKLSNLDRIEEIINFFTERVRQKFVETQLNEVTLQKVRSKQKETMNEHEAELDLLRKKLQQKQANQKTFKSKIRDASNESADLFERINQKQKELSSKMTQIYQLKTMLKESEKIIQILKNKQEVIQKEKNDLHKQISLYNKENANANIEIKEENAKLRQEIQDLSEELQKSMVRQSSMLNMNKQLSEELTRWRSRFDDNSLMDLQKKSSEIKTQNSLTDPMSTSQLRSSTVYLNNNNYIGNLETNKNKVDQEAFKALQIQNMNLASKIQGLQRQNKQISRDMINLQTTIQRYQQMLKVVGNQKAQLSKGLDQKKVNSFKQKSQQLYQMQVQSHYKQRVEDVSREWKDKLCDIVHKYEDKLELMEQQMEGMTKEREELEGQIFLIAKEKYQIENKLIQKEKEMYQFSKSSRSIISISEQDASKDSRSLQQIIQFVKKSSMQSIPNTKTSTEESNNFQGTYSEDHI